MNHTTFRKTIERVCREVRALHNQAHLEYASDENVFDNFERIQHELGIDRKHILWTYFLKHKDGITAYLKGRRLQREDVRGRINDAITYLLLLRGMIDEEEGVRE
jgi:hypothetical protein